VRLGKIKCAANWVGLWVALQPFLFCEGIAKRLCRNLHCRSVYVCRLMVALSGLRVADNGLRVGDVALCCPEASGRQGNIAYTLLAAVS
jgi:hypothetical protein